MRNLDKFRGCLIGGAAGDALGYAVEFARIDTIQRRYGEPGIAEYELRNGVALISDDTQMTLFTANGLLLAAARGSEEYAKFIGLAYQDWYQTQYGRGKTEGEYCWLAAIPELNHPRAPGNTCMSALSWPELGTPEDPINHSKGCGGVMRAAPVGLFFDEATPAEQVQRVGAEAAALTHGHELGWLPAAALADIVHRLAYGLSASVEDAARATMDAMPKVFPRAAHIGELRTLLERAMVLAKRNADDLDCLRELGEGWVGDEALAVALYCAAKYEDDFDRAMIAAVNHSGDSDSTGAVCGNILGAKLGLSGISGKYREKLECREILLEIADDLGDWKERVKDADWRKKYTAMSPNPQ